jgi:RNA polymerase sigma factor (sigma-70 family)
MAVTVSDERTDRDLVEAARTGDREAFVELYERYFNPVFDFATRMTRDRDEAADIAQESFIKALERLGSLNDGHRFKSWIFTIARNETLDRLRRSKRMRPLAVTNADGETEPLDVIDPDRLADPADAAEANAIAGLVWEAAAGLDPRQLTILDLHLRQGLSSAEIADVMGVTRNNGYVMVNRLKEAVQGTIEALLLVRQGRDSCEELAGVVEEFETAALSPELRRAVNRHASDCGTCTERKRSLVAPLAVMGAFAPIPPAQGLSADVLERVLDRVPETAAGLDGLVDVEEEDPSTLVSLDGNDTSMSDEPEAAALEALLGLTESDFDLEPEW